MIRLVIPGSPPRKNRKTLVWANRNPDPNSDRPTMGRKLHPAYKSMRDAMLAVWCTAKAKHGYRTIEAGALEVTITAYWPTMRHLDIDVPNGDSDAPVEVVLDALKYAGVYDDDARVVRTIGQKRYDAAMPRVEIEIAAVAGVDRQVDDVPITKLIGADPDCGDGCAEPTSGWCHDSGLCLRHTERLMDVRIRRLQPVLPPKCEGCGGAMHEHRPTRGWACDRCGTLIVGRDA